MSSRFIEDVLHMPECNLTNISATSGDIFNTEALTIRYGVVGVGITNPNYSNLEYMLQVKPNINVHENIYFGQGDNVSSIGVGEGGGQNSIIYKSMLHDFKDLSNKTLLSMSEERATIASRGLWLGNTVLFKENDSTIPNPLNTVSINGTVLSNMDIYDNEGNNKLIRIENTNEYYFIFNENGYIDIGNQGDIDVELLIIGGGGAGGNGNKHLDAYGGGGAGGEVIHIPSYKMKKGTRYEMSVSSDGYNKPNRKSETKW